MSDDNQEYINKALIELSEELGVDHSSLIGIFKESDWSFLLKLCAIFESSLDTLIVETLGKSEIRDVVSFLDLGNSKSGKLVLARALDIVSSEEKSLIMMIAKMRNKLAHDATKLSFDLCDYYKDLDNQNKTNFYNTLTKFGLVIEPKDKYKPENLKFEIWIMSLSLLTSWNYRIKTIKLEGELNDNRIKFYEQNAALRQSGGWLWGSAPRAAGSLAGLLSGVPLQDDKKGEKHHE